ncbi:MAG: outer membrane beta-barrel protein, partial [bacterium]
QQNRSRNLTSAANSTLTGAFVNSSDNDTRNHTTGDNLSNRITIRHRFAKRGRNVSAEINTGRNSRDGERDQLSTSTFEQNGAGTTVVLDQRTESNSTTNSLSTRIAYTEPLVPGWQAQATYNPSWTWSTSDARTSTPDAFGAYTEPDLLQSNTFENRNAVQRGGLAVLHTRGTWRWLTQASLQQSRLASDQTFPETRSFERTFTDVLPSMTLSGTVASKRNIRLNWNTSTNAPSISQLQNVLDRSNPLSLSTGNPDLRQTYVNNVSLRVSEAEPFKMRSRFMFLNVSRTGNPIGNSTITAVRDTTIAGVFVGRGTQFTRPVNLAEPAWNANLFAVQSLPAKFLKSNWSLNGGATYGRTPTLVNGETNLNHTWALRTGTVLASNISQNLDFTLSYQGSYNITRSSLTTNTTGDYYAHTIGFRITAVTPQRIVIRQEASHSLQTGVAEGFDQNVVMWNASLGRKFFKNDTGELRITLTDVLQQERAVARSFTETYNQDTSDRVLGRFVQAVFTLNFK